MSPGPIVKAPPGCGGVGNGTWSPDGKRFAYKAFDSGNLAVGTIWGANADGSNQHLLYDPKGALLGFVWGRTPAGDRLAFVGVNYYEDQGQYGDWGIYTIDPAAPPSTEPVMVLASFRTIM